MQMSFLEKPGQPCKEREIVPYFFQMTPLKSDIEKALPPYISLAMSLAPVIYAALALVSRVKYFASSGDVSQVKVKGRCLIINHVCV